MSNMMTMDIDGEPKNDAMNVGVYTSTFVSSPSTRWVLAARLRSPVISDVVFINEDGLLVKQIVEGGHLVDVASNDNFDARIRAAAVLHFEKDFFEDGALIKAEADAAHLPELPSDVIVLTLDSNSLVFLYLRARSEGHMEFVQSSVAIPAYDRQARQPGEYLAIDPFSRALAIAAHEGEIIIYSTKQHGGVQLDMRSTDRDWCPVLSSRLLRVEGVIQNIEFLYPALGDDDHVVLVVIVINEGRIKALWIDWYASSGTRHAQLHPEQALDWAHELPTMLIPLEDAAFLLFIGDNVTLWRNLISGLAEGKPFLLLENEAIYPGNSSCRPLWTSWSRPERIQRGYLTKDKIYVLREDGALFVMSIKELFLMESNYIGNLDVHHGHGFVTLSVIFGRDLIIVAGETSPGRVVYVDNPTLDEQYETITFQPPAIDAVQTIPNWSSVTEIAVVDPRRQNGPASKKAENMLVTSGRQPFGCMTELRKGVEVRMLAWAQWEDLSSVSDFWTLPTASDDTLIFMSSHSATEVFLWTSSYEFSELETCAAFSKQLRTICAGHTIDGNLIQITPYAINISNARLEVVKNTAVSQGHVIVAAAIVHDPPAILTAESREDSFIIRCQDLRGCRDYVVPLESQPLYITGSAVNSGLFVCVSTTDGRIAHVLFQQGSAAEQCYYTSIPALDDEAGVCEYLCILPGSPVERNDPVRLIACGLRDGRIVSFSLDYHTLDRLVHIESVQYGLSTVRLVPLHREHASILAISGGETSWIHWRDSRKQSMTIESAWLTDKDRPEFAQGAIIAAACLPEFDNNPLSPITLIMSSRDELFITLLDTSIGSVPRHISVTGTPYRLTYAESIRSYVLVTMQTDLSPTVHALPRTQTRRIWPAIDFVPSKSARRSASHNMQPGERVYSIIEWSHRRDDKTYSHILVGGSYISKKSGARRGQVTFLKPLVSDWVVTDVNRVHGERFPDEVFALAMYDPVTYVACAGAQVYLKRVSIDSGSWSNLCLPFHLASQGIGITVVKRIALEPLIFITTARDSMIVLSLQTELEENGQPRSRELKPAAFPPQTESLLSHYVLPDDVVHWSSRGDARIVLLSTKYCKLVGLECAITSPPQNGHTLFEAHLPRSLTRLMHHPSPGRKPKPPEGVISDRMVGCSANGSVTSIVLLNDNLWRRLFWLQRLCEWSKELSPHSFSRPAYNTSGGGIGERGQAFPIGLRESGDVAMLRTSLDRSNAMHIDGDVLARILTRDGMDAIRAIIELLAQKSDSVGSWMHRHLNGELTAAAEMIEIVRRLRDVI